MVVSDDHQLEMQEYRTLVTKENFLVSITNPSSVLMVEFRVFNRDPCIVM